MAVTEYKPINTYGCRYSYDKLENVVFLVSEDHIKDIHIDNGEAYIDDLTEAPLRLEAFNIQLNEESSLDERYKFTKSVTFSLNGYVPFDNINEKFYVILKSVDKTLWMVNVDFPAKVTYTFNLNGSQYQTDFTFSSVSNFPTLRLASDIDEGETDCKEFRVTGIDYLEMLETNYCRFENVSGTVHTYGKDFVGVDFLKNTCSLVESYDGENVTTTVQFNIAFDAYKSSWHYNLLEFLKNRYSTIIKVKGIEKYFFSGFNYGLQPSFTVSTTSQNGDTDIITITLVETSLQGSTSRVSWSEVEETETSWVYIRKVGNIQGWECVGLGIARYLLQQEINQLGEPTGRYKAFEGYTSHFPTLNIVGEFEQEYRFGNSECTEAICQVNTNIPTTIVYNAPTCYTYSYSAGCDWYAAGMETYMTVTPFSGVAGTEYTISVCNTKIPTGSESSTFEIVAGNNTKIVNVNLTTDSSILNPRSRNINCLSQNVTFTFYQYCPVTVTSIDQRLTYNLTNNQLIVSVPRNSSVTNDVVWNISVKDCQNKTQSVTINQDNTYERWANTGDYLCSGTTSYVKQQRFTGTTSNNINTPTQEYRMGAKIADNDSRCGASETKWETSTGFTCVDGDKWSFEEEYKRPQGGTWQKTGNTRLKEMVESSSTFCNQTVQYKWELTDKWECYGGDIPTPYKFYAKTTGETVYSAECDSTSAITSAETWNYRRSMTSIVIGQCVKTIDAHTFDSCHFLSSVTIPNTVETIGTWAFFSATSLVNIDIPDSVTTIDGNSTFARCTGLTSMNIGSGVTTLPDSFALNCGSLSRLNSNINGVCNIPNTVTSIGNQAFCMASINSGSSFTTVNIPNSVQTIEGGAFWYNRNITTVTIGSGLTTLGCGAFEDCTALTSVTINAVTPPTILNQGTEVGRMFHNTNNCPIYVPADSVDIYKATQYWADYSSRLQAIP